MRLQSLKSKLLLGVFTLVICSGVLISLIVTHRYSRSLFQALAAQAQYLGHAVALQAADLVLINDPVGLEKMLDHQLQGNPSLAYLFVVKDGQVLAHTFPQGIPIDLISANGLDSETQPHSQEIVSERGEYTLDMALPIFEGKAGILRLGFSENLYRQQVGKLWLQMTALTLGILLLALGGSLLFVRRITGPLTELAQAVDRVDQGELEVQVRIRGEDEVAALAASFNGMVGRLQAYTQRLEEQTMELERAHSQTRTFCGIVQEIGALNTLRDIGAFLTKKFQHLLQSSQMAFIILNDSREAVFLITEQETTEMRDPAVVQNTLSFVEDLDRQQKPIFTNKPMLASPPLPQHFHSSSRQAVVPLSHGDHSFGALLIACGGECRCSAAELDLVTAMLKHAAGVIKRAVLHEEEIRELQNRLESTVEFCGIVSKDAKMQVIFKLIEDIAPTDATVLIQGESGTGKELVARAIHQQSPRKDKPFIVIDCSAYPATLLEGELFGHEKGAFTGAIRQKSGRFEQAHGGTVFLDEIGEIPLPAQIKLLRVLQTQKFERLGGEKTLSVDVRILAATNKDLLQEVKKGLFREDLFYRLNVIPIHLPALEKRRNDIPLLARHFLRRFAVAHGKSIDSFSSEAMRLLLDHPWPGNVRELENTIEHAVVLAKGPRIEVAHLPAALNASAATAAASHTKPTMVDHEKKLLEETMEQCGWNKKQAARRLGISRSTLYEKLKKHRVSPPIKH